MAARRVTRGLCAWVRLSVLSVLSCPLRRCANSATTSTPKGNNECIEIYVTSLQSNTSTTRWK